MLNLPQHNTHPVPFLCTYTEQLTIIDRSVKSCVFLAAGANDSTSAPVAPSPRSRKSGVDTESGALVAGFYGSYMCRILAVPTLGLGYIHGIRALRFYIMHEDRF